MSHGPLGKYSQMVAAVLATFIVFAAVSLRVIGVLTDTTITSPFVDNAAWVALGAVFGASAATSVNGGQIQAAHKRLDMIAAPPAEYLENKVKDNTE